MNSRFYGCNWPVTWQSKTSRPKVPGRNCAKRKQRLDTPATGQAVITDIGDANDIHPRNKRDVGYRLCRSALKVAYGRKIVASGPTYRSMEHDGNRIILTFGSADGGLRPADDNRYGYLRGFTIAGADQEIRPGKSLGS